ncbi:MAG: DUF4013 domain-containing protein [Syntrophorhabdaceae bacterium]|nr:DUF4013 domain-containing protein [Syntrophorhabdaceae bacterium]
MDLIPFIRFTINSRYIARWIYGGLALFIPVLNFFSIGFLSRTSRLILVGGMGIATWQEKYETWIEGLKLLFVFILYNAIPFFMFSCGFFLTTLNSFTAFFGHLMIKGAIFVVFPICSFFLPFAFTIFAERTDFRDALEFEQILRGIREVLVEYIIGYVATLAAIYIALLFMHIPYLVGFLISSVLTYYALLLSAFYFTGLYRRTSLSMQRIPEEKPDTEEP